MLTKIDDSVRTIHIGLEYVLNVKCFKCEFRESYICGLELVIWQRMLQTLILIQIVSKVFHFIMLLGLSAEMTHQLFLQQKSPTFKNWFFFEETFLGMTD